VTKSLELATDPRSVRQARVWVTGELDAIGRDDLVDAAALGVSELVTNALLHAQPPLAVRLAGTTAHPRVEVEDGSPTPPALRDMTRDGRLMATIGRGLGIVATYSRTWGAEVSGEGKIVWFEPAAEDGTDAGPVKGDVFDLTARVEEIVAASEAPTRHVMVRLIGMPVQVFVAYRLWYEELRRELRLLALTHGEDYPLAVEISDLTLQVASERRQARGVEKLDQAVADGLVSVDLEYDVPVTTADTMGRVLALLEQADAFCEEQRLLTLAPSPQQQQVRRWYHGEFARQGRGEPPVPWPGTYTVESRTF
jgi:anti-sigma regulatory factor (Ser/Thr protein kinase)